MKRLWVLIFLLAGCLSQGHAQQVKPLDDGFHDAEGNTWHQLFLDFKADSLLELHYINSSDPVDGILSPDGFSILIKNYPGDRAVKAVLRIADGESREISKGKCFIDPVLLTL